VLPISSPFTKETADPVALNTKLSEIATLLVLVSATPMVKGALIVECFKYLKGVTRERAKTRNNKDTGHWRYLRGKSGMHLHLSRSSFLKRIVSRYFPPLLQLVFTCRAKFNARNKRLATCQHEDFHSAIACWL